MAGHEQVAREPPQGIPGVMRADFCHRWCNPGWRQGPGVAVTGLSLLGPADGPCVCRPDSRWQLFKIISLVERFQVG